MTDAPTQKTLDEMRSDMVRAIEEGDRVLVEKLNALGEYDVSIFPGLGGQFVQFAERAAYLRGLEDAAKVAERRAAYARNAPDWKPIPPLIEAEALRLAAAIRALAKEDRK